MKPVRGSKGNGLAGDLGASGNRGGPASSERGARRRGRGALSGERFETKALDIARSPNNESSPKWKCSLSSCSCSRPQDCVHACLNVGPLDSADMEVVEGLYKQARDAYHSGTPILSDDHFDSLESHLRYERSKLVSKGPRCSLRGLNIYSDASLDKSQTFLLASFWSFLSVVSWSFAAQNVNGLLHSELFESLNFIVGTGFFTAFAKCLGNVLKGNEVAITGKCPNCAEEVYAFADFNNVEDEECEVETRCHMCRRPLLYKITKHKGIIRPMSNGKEWAYGKIYSKNVAEDYSP